MAKIVTNVAIKYNANNKTLHSMKAKYVYHMFKILAYIHW